MASLSSIRRIVAAGVLLCVAGCKDAPEAGGAPQAVVPRPDAALFTRQALLADHLPADTAVYVRFPALWDWVSGVRDDALAVAKNSEPHREALKQIQVGLHQALVDAVGESAAKPLQLFLNRLRGPVEMAILRPPDGSLAPENLTTFRTDVRDLSEMSTLLEEMAEDSDQLRVISALDDEGRGSLLVTMLPVYVKFDAATGLMTWLSGLTASADRLDEYVAAFDAPPGGALTDHENRFDPTGDLPALWLNIPLSWEWIGTQVPQAQRAEVEKLGLHKAEYLWMGSTARDGRATLRLDLKMPADIGFRTYLPVVDQASDTSVAGDSRLFIRLAMPSPEEALRIEETLLASTTQEDREKYQTEKSKVESNLGFEFVDILRALGPDVLVLSDDAGYQASFAIRDRGRFDQIMEQLSTMQGHSMAQHSVDGIDIGSWRFPTLQSYIVDEATKEAAEEGDELPKWLIDFMTRPRTRIYWREIDGRWVIANVPQVLVDHAAHPNKSTFASWADDGLGLDLRHAVVAFGGTLSHSPREAYYAYLELLAVLGDLVEVDVDLTKLPSARQAGLPAAGRYVMQMDSGPEFLSTVLSYEHSAMELLATDSPALIAVAATGIIAAIAIPAYQDYENRASVAEVITQAERVMSKVLKYREANGEFPNAERAEIESLVIDDPLAAWIVVAPDTGVISVEIEDEGRSIFAWLVLEPFQDESGAWTHRCQPGSDSENESLLPVRCRWRDDASGVDEDA